MRQSRVLSEGFGARVAERLAAEPTVLAPRSRVPGFHGESRKWFALSAAASVAAVALVGWLAFAPQQPPGCAGGASPGGSQAEHRPVADGRERLSARAPGLLAAGLAAGDGALRAHRRRARGGTAQVSLKRILLAGLCAGSCTLVPAAAHAQSAETLGWLRKMHDATQKLSYTGTFVYQNGGRSETSRITRYVDSRRRHREARGDGRHAARDRAHQGHRALLSARCSAW